MGQIERMDYDEKTLIKIFSNYCFYEELKNIYLQSSPVEKDFMAQNVDLNYYGELFIDVLSDIFQHPPNEKKSKEISKKLELKLVNTDSLKTTLTLEEMNFLLGVYRGIQHFKNIPSEMKKRINHNVTIVENLRGFKYFNDLSERDLSVYLHNKHIELDNLEDELGELLSKHMSKKYGMGGIMMNTRSGQIREF